MSEELQNKLERKIDELQNRLEEYEQLVEAIKAGEVDAFAIQSDKSSEIYTLQSGDFAYRVLIEEIEEGAINVSEDGLIVFTNQFFLNLLNLSYEKVIGTSFFEFIHEDSKADFNRLFGESLKGKSKGEINLLVNGISIPVYVSLTSLQPKLPSIGILITDLTEKKKSEKIKESEKELQQLVKQAPVSIVLYEGAELICRVANETALHLMGKTEAEVLNKKMAVVFPEVPERHKIYCEVFRTGNTYSGKELKISFNRFGKSHTGYYDVNYSPWHGPDGNIKGVMSVGIEVTEKVLARKQIEEISSGLEQKVKDRTLEIINANQQLNESKDLLQSVFDASLNGICLLKPVCNSSGRIVDFEFLLANRFTTDYVKQEVKGKRLLEIFPGFLEAIEEFRMAFESGKSIDIEQFYDVGNYKNWFRLMAVRSGDNLIVGFEDITRRKNSEQEIKQQNLFINNLTSIFPDMMSVQEYPTRKMIYYNREPFKILGFEIDDLLKMTVEERNGLVHPGDRNELLDYMSSFQNLSNEDFSILEYRAKNKTGDWVWLRARGKVFDRNSDGSVKSILNIIQNITPQKIAELQLREKNEELKTAYENLKKSKEHFTLLFQVSPVAKSLTRAKDGIIIDVNPAWEKMFHKKREQVVGKTGIEIGLLTEITRKEEIIKVRDNGGKLKGNEFDFELMDGKVLHTSLSGTSIEIEGVEYFLTAFFDITERKKAEEQIISSASQLKEKNIQLQQINEELESFNYIASHDLQEPLRKIETFLDLLRKNMDDAEKSGRYIAKTIESSRRMSALIQSVLNYSRISKTSENEFSVTDLNKILDDVKNDLELRINESKVVIQSDKLPLIKSSPLQMHQLFSNLIGNALKFAKEKPRIRITSRILSIHDLKMEGIQFQEISLLNEKNISIKNPDRIKFAEIKFSDNGIGFESQYSKKIFDLFQRLHSTAQYSGTGIGLSIAKKIVEQHHGYISAQSEPDKGATFTVWLPVEN